jgi:hypothetical protein
LFTVNKNSVLESTRVDDLCHENAKSIEIAHKNGAESGTECLERLGIGDLWTQNCKGNPNSLDKQLFTQDIARGNEMTE